MNLVSLLPRVWSTEFSAVSVKLEMRRKRCPHCHRLFQFLPPHLRFCSFSNQSGISPGTPHPETSVFTPPQHNVILPLSSPMSSHCSLLSSHCFDSALQTSSRQRFQLPSTDPATQDTDRGLISVNDADTGIATPFSSSGSSTSSVFVSSEPVSTPTALLPTAIATAVQASSTTSVLSPEANKCLSPISTTSADKSTPATTTPPLQHSGLADVAKQSSVSTSYQSRQYLRFPSQDVQPHLLYVYLRHLTIKLGK